MYHGKENKLEALINSHALCFCWKVISLEINKQTLIGTVLDPSKWNSWTSFCSFPMGNFIFVYFEENSKKQRKSKILNRVNVRFFKVLEISANWCPILNDLQPSRWGWNMGLGRGLKTVFRLSVLSPSSLSSPCILGILIVLSHMKCMDVQPLLTSKHGHVMSA